MYRKSLFLCGCIILLISAIACGLPTPPLGANSTSTAVVVTPVVASYRPHRVIQICLDTPPLYPAATFTNAAKKIASWIDQDVAINQAGFDVYVGEIRSQSFQVNVMDPILVPAIQNDQPQPTPEPGYTPQAGDNGYQVAQIQATISATNNQSYSNWQSQIKQNHATLATIQQQVKTQTDQLRNLPSNVDHGQGADIYGCLADAAQHFQRTDNKNNYLIIASAFINNTNVDYTHVDLNGAHVYGIYRDCSDASVCADHDSFWKDKFNQMNADPNVVFYDDQQTDAQAKPVF